MGDSFLILLAIAIAYALTEFLIKYQIFYPKNKRRYYFICYIWQDNKNKSINSNFLTINTDKFNTKKFISGIKEDINKKNKGVCETVVITSIMRLTKSEWEETTNE